MSAHVLLNLQNELGKRDKLRGLNCRAFYNFFAKSLINRTNNKNRSMNVRFFLSYDPKAVSSFGMDTLISPYRKPVPT